MANGPLTRHPSIEGRPVDPDKTADADHGETWLASEVPEVALRNLGVGGGRGDGEPLGPAGLLVLEVRLVAQSSLSLPEAPLGVNYPRCHVVLVHSGLSAIQPTASNPRISKISLTKRLGEVQ